MSAPLTHIRIQEVADRLGLDIAELRDRIAAVRPPA